MNEQVSASPLLHCHHTYILSLSLSFSVFVVGMLWGIERSLYVRYRTHSALRTYCLPPILFNPASTPCVRGGAP